MLCLEPLKVKSPFRYSVLIFLFGYVVRSTFWTHNNAGTSPLCIFVLYEVTTQLMDCTIHSANNKLITVMATEPCVNSDISHSYAYHSHLSRVYKAEAYPVELSTCDITTSVIICFVIVISQL